jgi:Ca-activated chloride channel family protein
MVSYEYGAVAPSNLYLAVVLAAVFIFETRGARLRAAAKLIFGSINTASMISRYMITVTIGAVLLLAAIRPYWGYEDIKIDSRGADVIFLVDISRSMYAQDLSPSRLEVAKRKIKDLVQVMTQNNTAARFGITVFAGDGYTVCPVTTDRGVLGQFIDVISPDLVTSLGSNLKAGINAALGRLDEATTKSSRVILISDGEDKFLQETQLIEEIKNKGVRLDVLGVGTPEGSSLVLPNGSPLLDSTRNQVISVLNEASLMALSEAGGGVYARATLDDQDITVLSSAPTNLRLDGANNQGEVRSYREFGPWLTLAALALLCLSNLKRLMNPLLSGLIVPFLFISSMASAHATPTHEQSLPKPLFFKSPFESYQKGDYEQAVKEYSSALKQKPNDRVLMFGLASSLYRSGKFEESEQLYKKLSESAQNGREFFESRYNHGNSLLGLNRYNDAIDAYWSALDVKPGDEAAKHNLSVARALLEAQQNATPTPTPTPTPSARPSPDTTPSPQPSPSPEANPSPDPSKSPDPNSSPKPDSSPTSDGSDSDKNSQDSPTQGPEQEHSPQPTNQPNSSPSAAQTEASDRLKESAEPEQEKPPAPQTIPSPEANQAVPEAQAWLESLPDSPLLIRRHRGEPNQGNQTW